MHNGASNGKKLDQPWENNSSLYKVSSPPGNSETLCESLKSQEPSDFLFRNRAVFKAT